MATIQFNVLRNNSLLMVNIFFLRKFYSLQIKLVTHLAMGKIFLVFTEQILLTDWD